MFLLSVLLIAIFRFCTILGGIENAACVVGSNGELEKGLGDKEAKT